MRTENENEKRIERFFFERGEREREKEKREEKGINRNGKVPYNYTIIMIIF